MKVFIVGGTLAYEEMFKRRGFELVKQAKDADFVQFTGGEDVYPGLYHHHVHPHTHFNLLRDERERVVFNICAKAGIPMAGICRGAQFLNVMSGGALWQDVSGHATSTGHTALDHVGNKLVKVSSTHHQMMIPHNAAKVLMTAKVSTRKERCHKVGVHDKKPFVLYISQGPDREDKDIEAVYYKETRCLCFQPHPEFSAFPECTQVYFEYIQKYLLGGS